MFITQQSYSEARMKIRYQAFEMLHEASVETMMENCHKTWHGYRVTAIDGSKIKLPTDKNLLKHFGGLGANKTAPTAQGSILYDVMNDIVIDASLEPMAVDERTIAIKHIEKLGRIAPNDKNLIIFDRGYPSFELIELLESLGFAYVMRARRKFNRDIDAQTKSDGYVWLVQGENKIRVRIIKFTLDSGEEEVLITNITDKRLGKKAFKKLYFMRWPVETKYDIVKNKLQFENFNTRTVEGIMQDFYATMLLTNFVAAAAIDVKETVEESRKDKENKYHYKANTNEIVGILKDRLVLALLLDSPEEQAVEIDNILAEITRYVVPIKPKRSVPRNKSPRDNKFSHNQKANC
jgi:hypothetical protein